LLFIDGKEGSGSNNSRIKSLNPPIKLPLGIDFHYSSSLTNGCLEEPKTKEGHVGLTSSLHYYYLEFVVLTYLAYLIAVNTSYRSLLGTTDPGIQALIALD
jgi:hypothetical protein